MSGLKKIITPFIKQCFVTCGVFLNMMQHGLMVSFPAMFISQLQETRYFVIDESSASWIASINGFGLFLGILITPLLMSRFGRRDINFVAATIMTAGWLTIYFATNLGIILAARFFQGMSTGFTAFLCSVLIGEYTSPKNRGILLATITSAILFGAFLTHTIGLFVAWKTTALMPAVLGLVDIIIIFKSPETPTFLAIKGRYDECKKSFRWLRGNEEDEELHKLLEAVAPQSPMQSYCSQQVTFSNRLTKKLMNILTTLKEKRFYKCTVIIMIHLHMINLWSGTAIIYCFAMDIYRTLIGPNADIASVIISIDTQSVISNLLAIIIIKKFKRRTVLLYTTLLNVAAYFVIASYICAKINGLLPFDHPFIGTILGHIHIFSLSIGPLSLPNIVDGEIFPTTYRGIGGTISILFLSSIMTLSLKITPFVFSRIGIHGTYLVLGLLVGYALVVAMIILPETKDKTLQEIEDEFGTKVTEVHKEMSLLSTSLSKNSSDHVV